MRRELDRIVDQGIAGGAFPGAVALVERAGRLVYSRVRGDRQVEPQREPMTEDTLFDLASLTKPLATAVLLLHVCSRERIDLGSPLGRFLPELPPDTGAVTLLQVALHTGGLPAVPELYTAFPDPERVDPQAAERLLLSRRPEKAAGAEVLYSCTGYQLLGLVLKRVTGRRIRDLFREVVSGPCGLPDLLFCPPAELRPRVATTEYCAWRKRWIRGEVHDENSWCLGGDAGNAGLFGTAGAVLRWLGMFRQEGVLDGVRVLPEDKARLMHTCLTEGLNRRRAVGFLMHDAEAMAGPLYSAAAYGHTGFTGTSIWIEPALELSTVLLTSRVHLGRAPTQARIVDVRLRFHEAVFEQMA